MIEMQISEKVIKKLGKFEFEDENTIAKLLIENFGKEIVLPEDKWLLQLSFAENPTQEELNELLKVWDIEVKGGNKALLLAYFLKRHPHLKFSQYEEPRLKGLLNFARFKTLQKIAHFTKIGRVLNKENIPVMILKGGAMKYLRPDLPRMMGDIDILIPEEYFERSAEIAEELGYEYVKWIHSIDLHQNGSEEGILDIHQYIDMDSGFENCINKDLFKRAQKLKIFGVDAYLPCHEDMFFIALINMVKNLKNNTSTPGLLFALFDCNYLLENKPDFDWNIVIENAVKTKTQVELKFVVNFINIIVPNLLPEKITNTDLFKKEMREYCDYLIFTRFYYPMLKAKAQPMKLIEALKDNFKEYITTKPKYFVFKRLQKNRKMLSFILQTVGFETCKKELEKYLPSST